MTWHACLFEAKSIQPWLLATNRLREIVGASELVARLTDPGGLLDDALRAVGSPDRVHFSRRGGAAFYAFSEDTEAMDRLARLWPLLVLQAAPDLSFVHSVGQGTTGRAAFDDAHPRLLADRNRLRARLPQAGPFAMRHQRTGEPAVQLVRAKGAEEEADAATVCKLGFADGAALAKRFDPDGGQNAWPLNLTPEGDDDPRDFPFVDESRLIALVHADGNGLGQLLMRLSEATRTNPGRYIEIFRGFSDAVSRATEKAAQRATTEILGPNKKNGVYPARPIVLGGDDLTIVVRADLALPYTREFLASFERTSAKELAGLKRRFDLPDLPDCLTACAGIAYAKASQPFYLLHALAEGLCKHAKKWAKSSPDDRTGKVTSSLSFHRVTTAMVDDFETVLGRELTSGTLRHSLECYAIEGGSRLPALDDLLALQSLLADPKLGRGGTRQLLGIMGRDRNLALRRYTRWREVMEKRFGKELAQFDRLLESLAGVETAADLPFAPEVGGLRRSPLGDFITLRSVSSDAGEKPTDQEAAA